MKNAGHVFEELRQQMLCTTDDVTPRQDFSWPEIAEFNWAGDWFDPSARGNHESAVIWYDANGKRQHLSFEGLREHSDRVAGWLMRQGVGRGTRMLVALPDDGPLREIQLAALKLGAIIVPAPPTAGYEELMNVLAFSGAGVLLTGPDSAQAVRPASTWAGITVGGPVRGWSSYEDAYSHTARYRPREQHRSDAPFLLECRGGGVGDDPLRGRLHSRYASTVGRLTDLWFTRLRPGQRYAGAAPAGTPEHLWFSVLGPLTAGATTLVPRPADGVSAARLVDWAIAEKADSAYVPIALFSGSDTPRAGVELLSSLTAETLPLAGPAVDGAWPTGPVDFRWGVRHHQTSTGLIVPRGGSRVTVAPGHELHVVPAGTGTPGRAGEVWIGLRAWPERSTPEPVSFGESHSCPGVGALRTGLTGSRLPDGSVTLTAAAAGP